MSICIGNAESATDRLMTIWKSDLSDDIKQEFFKLYYVSTTVWLHHLNSNKTIGVRWELYKDVACCSEQILKQYPVKQLLYHHLPLISQTNPS